MSTRDWMFAGLLVVAAGLVVTGVALLSVAAAFVVAGFAVGAVSWLVLGEVES